MYIGIDIGGTRTRVASGALGKIQQRLDFPTKDFQTSLKEITDAVSKISEQSNEEAKKVGVGVPGPLETKTGKILNAPNLVGWGGVNVTKVFTEKLGVPTIAEHDCSVAALGEATYGVGVGKNPVLYITVGTGIGMGLIADEKIYKGVYNPEPGHQIISKEGPICSCGQKGDLESFSSGSGLKRVTGENSEKLVGKELWWQAMESLGIGITNAVLHYSPEIVIIGGGLSTNGDLFFDPIKKSVESHLKLLPVVPIVPTTLGEDSGLVGAITLAETSN
jgi:glucokinase